MSSILVVLRCVLVLVLRRSKRSGKSLGVPRVGFILHLRTMMMLIWKKEPVPVFQRISSLLRHEYKTFAARLVCFCVLTTRSLSRACYILLFVVLTSCERHERRKNEEHCRAFSFPHIKIGVSKISSNHGRKNRTHDDQNADGNHRSEQRGRAVCFAEIRRRRSARRVGVNVQCV